MSLKLSFLGGAGTVTGSKTLISSKGGEYLVDCGLFQGFKQLRLRNWSPLPVLPESIHAVLLTHAHLDHSGYLPLLAKEGYHGPIYASAGTRDLCRVLLPDSGHIQEEDAFFANRHGFSKHAPALPLYTKQEAINSLKQLHAERQGQWFEPIKGWKARFQPAGHILGAASLLLDVAGRRILFSGDLGRPDDSLMFPPDPPLPFSRSLNMVESGSVTSFRVLIRRMSCSRPCNVSRRLSPCTMASSKALAKVMPSSSAAVLASLVTSADVPRRASTASVNCVTLIRPSS